jgi:hypothetical protein
MVLVTVVYLTVLVLYVPLYGSIFQSLKRQRKCHPTATSGVWSVHNTLWRHCFPAIARRCRAAATAAAVGTYLVLHRHGVCVLCVVVCSIVVAAAAGTPHSRPLAVASGLHYFSVAWPNRQSRHRQAGSRRFRNFRISPFSRELEGFCAVQGVHRKLRVQYTNGIALYCIVLF